MQESNFHRLADQWLTMAEAVLEEADQNGAVEMELQSGALTLILPSQKVVLISKHSPMRQLWLASPISGGLHFSHDGAEWSLADGRTLEQVLSQELQTLAGIKIQW
jgi:CyaY protein